MGKDRVVGVTMRRPVREKASGCLAKGGEGWRRQRVAAARSRAAGDEEEAREVVKGGRSQGWGAVASLISKFKI